MNKFRKEISEQLRKHEGEKLKPYLCTSGKITIGVGRNLQDRGISKLESEFMLQNDIDQSIKELSENISFYHNLPDNIKKVLIDMCFNIGIGGLMKFTKTLRYIEEKRYAEAAKEMLNSKWSKQVGQRAITLSQMIKDESHI